MQAGQPPTPADGSRCEQGPTWSRAQMQSLGIQPRRPNRWRRRKSSPGAKSRTFIFTDTARLSRKLHCCCSCQHRCPGSPLPGAELVQARTVARRAAPGLPPDPHLKRRQPHDQRSSRKRLTARKRMAMATGSLKSRRTKMEWMR